MRLDILVSRGDHRVRLSRFDEGYVWVHNLEDTNAKMVKKIAELVSSDTYPNRVLGKDRAWHDCFASELKRLDFRVDMAHMPTGQPYLFSDKKESANYKR